MNKLNTGLLATALAASFATASLIPAEAASVYVPQAPSVSTSVQTVQYEPWRKRHFTRERMVRRNFSRDGDMYWNGHRGYREWHRGYRRHGDYWFPLAAFATGALITGAIVNSDRHRVYRSGDAHVQWCLDHYRSYRISDNSWKPNYGPRRECNSPYD